MEELYKIQAAETTRLADEYAKKRLAEAAVSKRIAEEKRLAEEAERNRIAEEEKEQELELEYRDAALHRSRKRIQEWGQHLCDPDSDRSSGDAVTRASG